MNITTHSRRRSWVTTAALCCAAALALGTTACSFLPFGKEHTAPFSATYRTIDDEPVVETITVKGTVMAGSLTAVSSSVTGAPVETIDVKVGDRVTAGQQLIRLDVSELNKQLTSAVNAHNASIEQAQAAIVDASEQLSEYQRRLNEGLAPEINSAEAGVRDADEALEKAQKEFDLARNERAAGRTPEIVAQQNSLDSARQQLFDAAIAATRAGVASANSLTAQQPAESNGILPAEPINTHLSTAQAAEGVRRATENLADAQKLFDDTLAKTDEKLAAQQRAVADAFNRKKDAAVALQSARLTSAERLNQLRQGVDKAQREATRVANTPASDTDKLRSDIDSAVITSPKNGVVTNIAATVGAPPTGALVTIAEDSTIQLRTQVKETNLAKLKIGQPVSITTTITGNETFAGKVTAIAPVATNLQPADAKSGPVAPDKNPTFAVDITFDGHPEGVRIGGSGKAKITISTPDAGLPVLTSAIKKDDDGKHFVLVYKDNGDGSYTIEKRYVTPGKENDFDTSVTGDVARGDKVINDPDRYLDQVGHKITPAPEAPKPSDGPGEKSQKG